MNKKNLWDLMIGMRVNPAASTELLGRLFGPGHKVVLEECSRTCYLFGPADSPPTGLPASPMRGLAYLPDGLTKQGRQLASWCYDWDAVAEAAQLIDDQMNWNRHAALGPAGVWPQHWGGLRVEDKVRTRYVRPCLPKMRMPKGQGSITLDGRAHSPGAPGADVGS